MAEMPFMPITVPDILGDAGDLPNAVFGAYCKLLFRWWTHGAMPQPDEKRLMRWAGTSKKGFNSLKVFLTETDSGLIQRKLARTYAEQLAKKLKASNSANAKHGNDVDQRTLSEWIAKAYAERGVSDLLTMKHEPIVEANASTQKEKNKNKKEKPDVNVSRETIDVPLAEGSPEKAFGDAFIAAFDHRKFLSWFVVNGNFIGRMAADVMWFETASENRRDQIGNRFGAWLDEYFGKGNWRVSAG